MKKTIIVILLMLFITLAVVSSDVLADYGDEYATTSGIMVVVSQKTDDQIFMYFKYDVSNPIREVNNQLYKGDTRIINDLSTLSYGLYRQQKIPTCPYLNDEYNPRNWYLSELNLLPIDSTDLPHSQHIGKIIAIDPSIARPITIERQFHGTNYNVRCFVSQSVVDMYVSGDINAGDYVIVSFIDESPNNTEYNVAIVVDKVYRSW